MMDAIFTIDPKWVIIGIVVAVIVLSAVLLWSLCAIAKRAREICEQEETPIVIVGEARPMPEKTRPRKVTA